MGEARQKARQRDSEWIRLFEPPLQSRIAISRPGARPASARKYEQGLLQWRPDTFCFNFKCNNKLLGPPEVYMILLQEKDTSPLMMGVCPQCAQYSNAELVILVRDQFGKHYGLDRQAPANSAKALLEFPPGVWFEITTPHGVKVQFAMPGREAPSIPGGPNGGPNVFVDLLEAGQLHEFMMLRRGVGNCHGITNALRRDLTDAGWAQHFAFKSGSCEVLKSEHDPDGMHSWLEINGWAIDAANGADRPVIITPVGVYYRVMQVTNASAVPGTEGASEKREVPGAEKGR
jgi:hypothetical protein